MIREGTLASLGVGEPDTLCPPPHQRPLTRGEQWERDHRDAPQNPSMEDYR